MQPAQQSHLYSLLTWLALAGAFSAQTLAQEVVTPRGERATARPYLLGLVVPAAAFCMGLFRSARAGTLLTKSAPLRAHVFVGVDAVPLPGRPAIDKK